MRERALHLLKQAVGPDAEFHVDQWEAIEAAVYGRKTLVVEKTGWGKSIVYFIATKLLREKGKGTTILISPLLSLMRNQLDAASRIGLRAQSINSNNTYDWGNVELILSEGSCDILLISPERLANVDFVNRVMKYITASKGIGMLVVDEAHCISDWGHDFRPDYRRIVRIVKNLPSNVPLLATTATANDRVVSDIKEQLGDDLHIIRGPLTRESLKIQVVKLKDQSERLAWLSENINKMPGSGIIYCLTKNDCNRVAQWLRYKGVEVYEYHTSLADNGNQKQLEEKREDMLMNNEIKALVSTVKLGMGYDKPDLGFVIHYQRPGSLVAYYQQIGRAGRKLDTAYTILLNGIEDDEIQEYFIESAFPSHEEMKKVLDVIEGSDYGIKTKEISKSLNMSDGKITKCLKMLEIESAVNKESNGKYFRTPLPWVPDVRNKRVTEQRYHELDRMKDFVELNSCYMKFIAEELDDPNAKICGRCSNCEKRLFFNDTVDHANVIEAEKFLKGNHLVIQPRIMWPSSMPGISKVKIPEQERFEEGRILCSYGDSGWGKLVKEDKYTYGSFRDELVDASAELIKETWGHYGKPEWVTSVPSLRRPELVRDFAMKVAERLGLPYVDAIIKTRETEQQKLMKNSYQQAINAMGGFDVVELISNKPVLVIDDIVDSRWTFTVCGALLRRKGSGRVYPFALASSAEGGSE